MSTLWIPCSIILLVAIEEKHNWNQEMQLIATYLYINKEHMCRIVDMYMHIYVQAQQHSQLNINHDHIYIYIFTYIDIWLKHIDVYNIWLKQRVWIATRWSGRICTKESRKWSGVWITGMDRLCGTLYFELQPYIYIHIYNVGPPSYKLVYKPH